MAKQKKKEKKKQHKYKTSSKERRKFDYLIILPYIIITIIIVNFDTVNFICAKAFTDGNNYFYDIKLGSVVIGLYVILAIMAISLVCYIDNAKKLDLTIKEYYTLKNPKAKKQTKSIVTKMIVAILLCVLCFCLGSTQKYVGEENAIVSYNLIKQDKEYLLYEDVNCVNVEMVYFSGIHAGVVHTLGKNVVEITLKTSDNEYYITEDSFDGDYDRINEFLSNFDKSIINYDDESKNVLNNDNF